MHSTSRNKNKEPPLLYKNEKLVENTVENVWQFLKYIVTSCFYNL